MILILAIAGAVGGILTTCLSSFPETTFDQFDMAWGGLNGGGVGLAIGVTLAIHERLWVRLLAGPVLGLMARMAAARFYAMDIHGEPINAAASKGEWFSGIVGGAWVVLWLILAHHFFLRKRSWMTALPVFLILGAFSRSVLPRLQSMEFVFRLKGLWLGGGFGLVMFLGMVLVLYIRRKHPGQDSNLQPAD